MKNRKVLLGSFKNEMCCANFEIPIDYCNSCKVERKMHNHGHPNSPCNCKDRSEHNTGNRRLFGTGESLIVIVSQSKQSGSKQHNRRFGTYARSEKFSKALEQIPPKHGLFSETSADNEREQYSR